MRRNVLVFALVMLGVLVLWFFLIWSPQSNKIDEARTAADAAENQEQTLKLEVQRLQALEKQAPQLRERAARADTAIPEDPQLAQFILQVQEAADASGVEWISVSPSPPAAAAGPAATAGTPQAGGVRQVAISMSVEGGYFQVQDFITRLETLSRAVKISSVALTGGKDDPTHLAAALSMNMFVVPATAGTTTGQSTSTPSSTTGG